MLVRQPDALLKLDVNLAQGELVAINGHAVVVVTDGAVHMHTRGRAGLRAVAGGAAASRAVCGIAARDAGVSNRACALVWLQARLAAVLPRAARRAGDDALSRSCRVGVAGASLDGLWLATGQTLTFATLDTETSLTLPAGWSIASTRRLAQGFSPLALDAPGRTYLPRVVNSTIVLSAPPDGLTLVSFGAERIVLEGVAGRLATTR